MSWNVLVTGGAGYVGAVLVPKLLAAGHGVTVLDLYLYGDDVLEPHPRLREVKGDMRDAATVEDALQGCDAVIHLACISNDPSYDLDPELGKSINYDCFLPLVRAAKAAGVKRFIYASSSSVYGVKDDPEVTEDLELEPLTDYSKFKALCEKELLQESEPGFVTCIIRPATVCGYSPRQRLDVIVNILTNFAVNKGAIKVFGGAQKRPNIHVEDMTQLYVDLLDLEDEKIDRKIYNAGYENHTVMQLAELVKAEIGDDLTINVEPTDDPRSYHVSSEKLKSDLGFEPKHTISMAIADVAAAIRDGRLTDSMNNPAYFNIKRMKDTNLK
ncbi:MAG: SDR family oxidoreductase [Rhodospirillales bacterium]|nr:SDR family oxidoreductase [Rhodospirillales bacterium]MBO6787730.1 SDR family oxidoreductase [Rhodospirillales bacterium]